MPNSPTRRRRRSWSSFRNLTLKSTRSGSRHQRVKHFSFLTNPRPSHSCSCGLSGSLSSHFRELEVSGCDAVTELCRPQWYGQLGVSWGWRCCNKLLNYRISEEPSDYLAPRIFWAFISIFTNPDAVFRDVQISEWFQVECVMVMLTGLESLQKGEVLPSFSIRFFPWCVKSLSVLPTHGHLCESQAQEYCTYLNQNNTVLLLWCHQPRRQLWFLLCKSHVFLCLRFCFVIVQKSQYFALWRPCPFFFFFHICSCCEVC